MTENEGNAVRASGALFTMIHHQPGIESVVVDEHDPHVDLLMRFDYLPGQYRVRVSWDGE